MGKVEGKIWGYIKGWGCFKRCDFRGCLRVKVGRWSRWYMQGGCKMLIGRVVVVERGELYLEGLFIDP